MNATLEALAGHQWANSYTILLAMESKEIGAAHKAAQLQEQFGCSFHSIMFTLHVLDPVEMPGKASNVNSAVRQFYHMASGDRSSYMLTIMDAGKPTGSPCLVSAVFACLVLLGCHSLPLCLPPVVLPQGLL